MRRMMKTSEFAPAAGDAGAPPPRRRVRTPGKHIVLFSLALTFMLGLSTTAIKSGSAMLEKHELRAVDTNGDGGFYAPQEFLVDLAPDEAGRDAFLKLTAKVVAKDAPALREIRARDAQIRERIGFFLRELSPEDFRGSEAMARVKAEMLKRVRLAVSEDYASDVVIEEIVIQ